MMMITSPPTANPNCSPTIAILVVFCWIASREVDENMATMENRMSRMTIIQTTLSPSRESMKFHRFFFFLLSAIFI